MVDQLQLNSKPKVVETLKLLIQETVWEEFDFKLRFGEQGSANFDEFKRKLSQQFPEVFEHCDLSKDQKHERMEAAITYARNYFTDVRRARLQAEGEEDNTTKNRKATFSGPSTEIIDLTGDSPGPPDSESDPIQTRGPLHPQVKLEEPDTTILPPTTTHRTHTTKIDILGRHTSEVADFLRSCNPDMRFLLNSFLAFGCRNRRFLENVAKSDDMEIEDFIQTVLRRHPPAHTPDTIREMDVWVLKKHFKHYLDT